MSIIVIKIKTNKTNIDNKVSAWSFLACFQVLGDNIVPLIVPFQPERERLLLRYSRVKKSWFFKKPQVNWSQNQREDPGFLIPSQVLDHNQDEWCWTMAWLFRAWPSRSKRRLQNKQTWVLVFVSLGWNCLRLWGIWLIAFSLWVSQAFFKLSSCHDFVVLHEIHSFHFPILEILEKSFSPAVFLLI